LKHRIAYAITVLALLAAILAVTYTLYTPKTRNGVMELLGEALSATDDDVQRQALLSALKALEAVKPSLSPGNASGCRVVDRLVELLEESIKVYIEELKRYSDIAENLDNLALMASYDLKRYGGAVTVQTGASGEVTVTVTKRALEEIVSVLQLINATAATKAMYVEMLRIRAGEIAELAQTLASLYAYCGKG